MLGDRFRSLREDVMNDDKILDFCCPWHKLRSGVINRLGLWVLRVVTCSEHPPLYLTTAKWSNTTSHNKSYNAQMKFLIKSNLGYKVEVCVLLKEDPFSLYSEWIQPISEYLWYLLISKHNLPPYLTFSQWPNFLTSSKEFWHESWHLDHRVLHYSALSSNGFHWNWAQKIMNVKKLWFILQLVSNEIYLHTKMTFENGFTSLLSDPIRNINMVSFPSEGYTLLIFSWSLPLLHTRLPVTDHIIINL